MTKLDEHPHSFENEWPFSDPSNTAAITTVHVMNGALPVLLVTHDANGDWQILCGTTNDPAEARVVCLGCAFENDPTIGELASLPRGWLAWRDDAASSWVRELKSGDDD